MFPTLTGLREGRTSGPQGRKAEPIQATLTHIRLTLAFSRVFLLRPATPQITHLRVRKLALPGEANPCLELRGLTTTYSEDQGNPCLGLPRRLALAHRASKGCRIELAVPLRQRSFANCCRLSVLVRLDELGREPHTGRGELVEQDNLSSFRFVRVVLADDKDEMRLSTLQCVEAILDCRSVTDTLVSFSLVQSPNGLIHRQ